MPCFKRFLAAHPYGGVVVIRIVLDFRFKAESKFRGSCTGVSFTRLSDLTQVYAWCYTKYALSDSRNDASSQPESIYKKGWKREGECRLLDVD